MKVSGRETAGFLANPPGSLAALLLFGPDAMRVALKREDFLKRRLGANASEEMRLTRMSGSELRSEPAALQDAARAMGFFPGPRAVLVTEATDGLTATIEAALTQATPEDALIVLEGGNLGKGSKLRKAVEAARNGAALGIYNDPPGRGEVEQLAKDAGVDADRDAMDALVALSQSVDPGDLRQIIEKLALYAMGDTADAAAVEAVSPATTEADLDQAINAAADGAAHLVGPTLARLTAQGATPVALVINTTRHFRALHAAASDPRGPDSGISRLRPPPFGPRRDRMLRQAKSWGVHRLESALGVLMETDLTLRSSARAPAAAVIERALIRIAMMRPRH